MTLRACAVLDAVDVEGVAPADLPWRGRIVLLADPAANLLSLAQSHRCAAR